MRCRRSGFSCCAGAKGGELETPRRDNLDTPRKPSSSKIFRGLKRRISRAFDGPTGKPQGETVDGDSAGSTPVTTPNSGRIRAAAPGEAEGWHQNWPSHLLPTAQASQHLPHTSGTSTAATQGQGSVPFAQAGRFNMPPMHPSITQTFGRLMQLHQVGKGGGASCVEVACQSWVGCSG